MSSYFSTGPQDPIAALFADKLNQYQGMAADKGDMVDISEEQVAKQQQYLERLKKMYAVQGDIQAFPDTKF